MSTRVLLRSPFGDTVVRDVVEGRWAEPGGDPDLTVGERMWALPGLVDAHSHLAAEELVYGPGDLAGAKERARTALAAGVTLLFDKGWTDSTAIQVSREVPEDERPEIEAAAKVIAVSGGHMPGFASEIDPSKIEAEVENQARAGAGWVKLMGDWPRRGVGPVGNFTLDELRRAVDTAEAHESRVAIHTMAREIPSMAVAAGVHSIEHGLFLSEGDVEALGSRGGMWVPTVLRVEATLAQLGSESSGGRLFSAGLANVARLLPLAVEAGVLVLAGTDLVGSPANVSSEAIRLAELGLSPAAALRAVGVFGHVAAGRSGRFSVGEPADAVWFTESPLDELGALAHPAAVMRMGRIQ